eukprot:GHRQ01033390.1.p1 GENE.GHRQ01033390.1~~GHRQ01033390.1.p1  ORF type:complete len:202 (+),score=53.51 GHRQ01033390.1:676-1281(+)
MAAPPAAEQVLTLSAAPLLQERAAAYIASIKQSADCWKLCCERFPSTLYPEVKFWCLQTLHEVICACYLQLDEGSRQMIKGALLTWLQRDCTIEAPALPAFLRNKLAQAIVAIVKREYPVLWPGFFRELVAAAGSGPGLADMFARIMVAVDEDVISLDIPRWVGGCCCCVLVLIWLACCLLLLRDIAARRWCCAVQRSDVT